MNKGAYFWGSSALERCRAQLLDTLMEEDAQKAEEGLQLLKFQQFQVMLLACGTRSAPGASRSVMCMLALDRAPRMLTWMRRRAR